MSLSEFHLPRPSEVNKFELMCSFLRREKLHFEGLSSVSLYKWIFMDENILAACYHIASISLYKIFIAAAKSLQSCLTLCDPIDGSPPGSPVPGILQGRTLEWVAISFSNAWKWKVKGKSFSCVRLFTTPWTAAHQAPRPWDFPGKSTGVGCHCLLRYLYEEVLSSFSFYK